MLFKCILKTIFFLSCNEIEELSKIETLTYTKRIETNFNKVNAV